MDRNGTWEQWEGNYEDQQEGDCENRGWETAIGAFKYKIFEKV